MGQWGAENPAGSRVALASPGPGAAPTEPLQPQDSGHRAHTLLSLGALGPPHHGQLHTQLPGLWERLACCLCWTLSPSLRKPGS